MVRLRISKSCKKNLRPICHASVVHWVSPYNFLKTSPICVLSICFWCCAVLRLLTQVWSPARRLSLAGGRRAVCGAGVDRVDGRRQHPLWIEPEFGHAPTRAGLTSLCWRTLSTRGINYKFLQFQIAIFTSSRVLLPFLVFVLLIL